MVLSRLCHKPRNHTVISNAWYFKVFQRFLAEVLEAILFGNWPNPRNEFDCTISYLRWKTKLSMDRRSNVTNTILMITVTCEDFGNGHIARARNFAIDKENPVRFPLYLE